MAYIFPQQKLSYAKKKANDFKWAKDVLDQIERYANEGYDGRPENLRKKVNYDLFNGKLDRDDFEYVCKPYGMDVGEMPAELRHYDIISPKLRVLFGEEVKRPFNYRVVTTNSESISEKERAKVQMLRDYVYQTIMARVQQEAQAEMAGVPQEGVDPEQLRQIEQQQIQAKTPPEIEEYMRREYQDAKEIQGQKILNYIEKKENLKQKFTKGWKHALIAGEEIYWAGIVNGEPSMRVVNPLYFDYDKDPDLDNIEDGQWAKYTMRMTPGSVVDVFGEYLSEKEIKDLYSDSNAVGRSHALGDANFNYDYQDTYFNDLMTFDFDEDGSQYIRVTHCEWRSLRKIGFLKYQDIDGNVNEVIVDETYKKDEAKGDIELKFMWIPEIWEGTKIGSDIYVNMRPKPNQHKDIDNLHEAKLGYFGFTYNNINATSISMIDRMKPYQYLYNIIMYRLEMDLASDRGKKFLGDINQIPSSLGMDMDKWLYYFDAMGIAWVNPHEEGKRGKSNSFNTWQAIDLSMAQTIQQKIGLLEYLEAQCGEVAGVSKQREGQIGPNELVGASQQAVIQSSHITEELFYAHNYVKENVLTGMIEVSKAAWDGGKNKKIQYILDDMSVQMLNIDVDDFTNSSYGVFVSNSAKDQEIYMAIKSLAQAAIQNQMAGLSDVVKMLSTDSTAELKILLEQAEEKKQQQQQQIAQQQQQSQQQIAQMQMQQKQQEQQLKYQMNKEDNDTKLEIARMKNETDTDINNNGIADSIDLRRVEEDVRMNDRKMDIEQQKINQKEKEINQKTANE
jgi:hypothetical protein